MVNYGNSKVYKIICNQTGLIYIGSTTTKLCTRIAQHKKMLKDGVSGTSKLVLENNDYTIILIEDYPCERKEQLLARERYYIETTDCVNKKIPLRTQKQWYEDNKERLIKKQIMWNNANREKVMEYQTRFKDKQEVLKYKGHDENMKLNIGEIYESNELLSEEDISEYIESNFNNK